MNIPLKIEIKDMPEKSEDKREEKKYKEEFCETQVYTDKERENHFYREQCCEGEVPDKESFDEERIENNEDTIFFEMDETFCEIVCRIFHTFLIYY